MADLGYRNPTFVMTLPFDQNPVQRYITDEVLSRTQRRWEWFTEARRLDSGLGTLTYLPAEIRRLIWKLLFECRDTLSCDGLWEYDHTCGPIFDLKAYYFGFGRRGLFDSDGLRGLRLVSLAVKGESDEAFLACRTFRFNHAENLVGFIDQLTPASAERLRSIDVGICTLCKYNHCFLGRSVLQLSGIFRRPLCSIFSKSRFRFPYRCDRRALDRNPHIGYRLT